MRIGLIGTGAIAQRHLATFENLGAPAGVVGHLATTPDKAAQAAARWGGRGFTAIDDFIRGGRPDAVFVTVPPAQHGLIEERLIADGIPFLVEKPLSVGPDLPERIADRLARTHLVVAVGYHWRAMDTMPAVRQFLAEHPPRMVLGEYHVGTPAAAWWRRQSESGGQMVEQACHLVDLARSLIGEARVEAAVAAHVTRAAYPDADIAATSAALLRFPGDVPGVISATCMQPRSPTVQLRIVCDDALATVTLKGATFVEGSEQRHLAVGGNPYVAQNRAFIAAVASGRSQDVFCSYQDALITHRLCHAIAAQSIGR
jgi:predicted dehydrogenase